MYVDDFLLFLDCWVMSRCSDSYSPGTIRSSVLERKKKAFLGRRDPLHCHTFHICPAHLSEAPSPCPPARQNTHTEYL